MNTRFIGLKKAFQIFLLTVLVGFLATNIMSAQSYNKLSKEEEQVIVHKGTEPPFSGQYNDFFEEGGYHCKKCNAKLFHSTDKFASSCGWPSFDDEIKGTVKRQRDEDGIRTEIVCANCNGHLGHVFEGEGLTANDTRYCVNSISLVFKPAQKSLSQKEAYFAGGCFWGVEHLFSQKEGVISAVSGYMGGNSSTPPSYQKVSQGNTGYFETVKVVYDPGRVSYTDLAKFFFEIHDPTQDNGQGPDIGEQYLSVAFCSGKEERTTVQSLVKRLKNKGYDIATKVLPAGTFWEAEEHHQDYYRKHNKSPYCHRYEKKF